VKPRGILAYRLLCPFCSVVAQVKGVTDDQTFVRLCCDHERTTATLPSKPGCVSYELADTPEGFRLFPATPDSFGTMDLDSERWTA
jgi:hypothetical protein